MLVRVDIESRYSYNVRKQFKLFKKDVDKLLKAFGLTNKEKETINF
nr:hypothetical protein [Borrelia miyamotoi]